MTGFNAFEVAREYIAVEVDDDNNLVINVRSPSGAIGLVVCRDCFGTAVLLAGIIGFLVATGYKAVETGDDDVFLDKRSPSGATVHSNS